MQDLCLKSGAAVDPGNWTMFPLVNLWTYSHE